MSVFCRAHISQRLFNPFCVSLLYTILPIEEAVRQNYEMQLQKNAEIIAAQQTQKRLEM